MQMHRKCSPLSLLVSFAAASTAVAQVPIEVETVTSRSITKQVSTTGTVTSPRTSVLSTAVDGLVATLEVDEGHRADAGDVLLELDAELAELSLSRARAEVRQRQTALADSRRRLDEAERVGPDGGIAQSRIETLRAEVNIEAAAVAAAEAVARERAAIVARHQLKAPFAGVVSQRYTELGEWVNPGDGLLELVAIDNLRFDFRVGQDVFGDLSMQTPVELRLDALPERTFGGRIQAIVPVKDPGARTFLLRVLADDIDDEVARRITPGMSARATLDLATGRRGFVVSRDAILRYPDGRITVWVVEDRDGVTIVKERQVSIGLEFDGYIEVRQGLDEGDVVVSRGNESLQEDQAVSIVGRDR